MKAGELRRRTALYDTADEPMINLTPLIDVVFVVLILFIIIAPLLERDRVQLAPGGEREAVDVKEDYPIKIHVEADDSIRYNKMLVTLDVLEAKLRDDLSKYPKARPLLFHDKDAKFGTYQAVKNTVEAAGFGEMDVVLQAKG